MSDWRDYILQHFREPIHRLTLVADPDGLMLEEELLAAIRQNGFDLLLFEDPVAFRYAYESGYRQHWDEETDTDLVVILRSPTASLRSLPYDLLQSGRTLAFSLPDLFPKLSYPVIRDLDRGYIQPLYEAYQGYGGPEMGDQTSTLFVLKHVYSIVPDMVKTPLEVLKLLLSRHARGERLPPRLDLLLLESLCAIPALAAWPLEALLSSATDFFAFLQRHWTGYLAAKQPVQVLAKETRVSYDVDNALPFAEPDVRAHMNTLFLEGRLKPIPLPDGWAVEGWESIGVQVDGPAFELRRFAGLQDRIEEDLPAADATHKVWMQFADRWAELTVLRHRLDSELGQEHTERYRSLHLETERRFADWMRLRYHTLHSLPFLPLPTMVHHIPHWMAARQAQDPQTRLALLVVDGLALDQWRIIRDIWAEEVHNWTVQEHAAFAWVPTLTPISRQATFAGTPPQFFPKSWASTAQDASHWQRFWRDRTLPPAAVGYLRNLGVKDLSLDDSSLTDGEAKLETAVEELIGNPQVKVVGLVLNTVDHVMHGMQLGTAGMHQQVQLWLTRYRYLTRLVDALLEAGFTICLTSDHGNVWARGIGRPSEGALVETRGERARVYTDPAFLSLGKQQAPTAVEWTNVGLPAGLSVLFAPELDAFVNAGDHAVCHGGISLEEVIVPFVEITREQNICVE